MKNLTCLAEGCVFPTDLNETGINANEIIVGPTRCGKTASVVEPKLLHTHNGSMIVSLTKRALVDKYASIFKKRGYEVWDFNLADPKQGNIAYDPLDFVESERDVVQLATTIVGGEPSRTKEGEKDPYWNESAISCLAAILNLAILGQKKEGKVARFRDFYKLYSKLELDTAKDGNCCTNLDAGFDWADKYFPGNQASRMWKTIRGNAPRTAACIYSIMNNAVDKLMNQELLEAMEMENRVSFETMGSKKVVLFVTTSPVNKSQQKLATMFFADAFRVLYEYAERQPSRELPVPVHLVCDDFACGSIIPDFDEYISVFCAKGISTTLLLQSESQLENMYGKHAATTIINNCDTYLYMGGMDDTTCYNISRRRNVPVEDVYSMPLEQVVLFRRGAKPVVARRYQTYEDQEYKRLIIGEAGKGVPNRRKKPEVCAVERNENVQGTMKIA